MTDQNKTLLWFVIDHSGSMTNIQNDMQGGINTLLDKQRTEPGECLVTMAEFDDQYDVLYRMRPLAEVQPYELIPRGMTALLDAVGKTVTSVGVDLAALPEDERPGTVLGVVVTDGMENSSKEWTADKVKGLVETQQNDYGWEFVFLGANMDAVSVGAGMGFRAASSMTYDASDVGVAATMDSLTSYVSTTRGGKKAAFTDADRKAAKGEGSSS